MIRRASTNRAGRTKQMTPPVEPTEKSKKKTGRAKKRCASANIKSTDSSQALLIKENRRSHIVELKYDREAAAIMESKQYYVPDPRNTKKPHRSTETHRVQFDK